MREVKQMNMLKQLNAAIEYIEANLCAEFDLDTAAGIACVTADSFMRFFSYMTGMTLNEYIRRRKLTLAAFDLQNTKEPIVDIAVRYGWDSAAAFSRAFIRQHGIAPSVFRKRGGALKIFPPASFHITIKGAKEMDFRIVELMNTPLFGIALPYEGMGYETHEDLRNRMWSAAYEDVPLKMEEYAGKKVAFFSTNCSLQVPLIQQCAELGAIYPQQCCPSPYHGYPSAFNISTEGHEGDVPYMLDQITQKVAEYGNTGRMSTWEVPVNMVMIEAGFNYAEKWIKGEITERCDEAALLKEIQAIAGDAAAISKYSDEASGEIANFFMILCPFYDF